MRLTLSILRCPPSVPTETRSFDGSEISIGRGAENDWVLPDPDRYLSKRHCMLTFHGGEWQLADLSSNGTFLNGESAPVGAGLVRRLRDGDRLRFGAYELEARLVAIEPAPDPAWARPYSADPFAPLPSARGGAAFPPDPPAVSLPQNFDPLAPETDEDDPWRLPTQADNSPATNDAFRPPPVVSALPDDWADDLLPGPAPAPMPPPPPAHPRPAPPAEPPPPPEVQPIVAVPLHAAGRLPGASSGTDGHALVAALLHGVGLPDTPVADPEALMAQVGEMLRAMVSGLRETLIARSAIKSEFRIERTMISARGNNPLKISADDDDALAALVGTRRRSDMPPPQAVADALRDIRLHELAVMAAMQTAVRALVARLDPAVLLQQAGSATLAMQRKARAWDAFEALHATVVQSLADDFDSVFGKSFARAYEQAHSELAGRERSNR